MTNEEKQALINALTSYISQPLNNPMTRSQSMEAFRIALAALTAQPVKLPDISAGKYYTEEGSFKAFDYKRDLKESIRTAGYEIAD